MTLQLEGRYRAELDRFLDDRRGDIYGVLVGLNITMLGFALAALTIVMGYAQSDQFALLRASRWHAALYTVFLAAMRASSYAAISTLVGLLFDRDLAPNRIITGVSAALTVLVILRIAHLLRVLEGVVGVLTQRRSRGAGE